MRRTRRAVLRAARRVCLAVFRPARRTARASFRPLRRVWRLARRATRLVLRFALLACLTALGMINLRLIFFAILSSRICTSDWTLGLRPKSNSFQYSTAHLGGGTLNGTLCVSLIMFVMLVPFFVVTELQEVLGERKLMQLIFRWRSSFPTAGNQPTDVRIATPGVVTQPERSWAIVSRGRTKGVRLRLPIHPSHRLARHRRIDSIYYCPKVL